MRSQARTILLCLAAVLLPLSSGCTPAPPKITPVEGVVLLDGQPLPSAMVTFAPDVGTSGAEMNSTGITDEKGHFQLTWMFKSEPGAVIGTHHVIITEAPPPAGARGQSQQAQEKMSQYLSSLKNRPIPKIYTVHSTTPLIVEVTPDKKEYKLELTRRKQ